MELEGSLPHSQVPANCPYPEPYQANPCLPTPYFEDTFIIILPSTPRSSKWSVFIRYPHQNPVYTHPSPICATYLVLFDSLTF